MPTVRVTTSGPVLEGRAGMIVRRYAATMVQAVAQDALAEVQQNLDRSIRNPTPYYETQIVNQPLGDARVVHDRGIVYGPWLEGTSSRNRTTRFKGYASFRRARDTVQARVPATIDRVVADLIEALDT